jgi:hypothetical protein
VPATQSGAALEKFLARANLDPLGQRGAAGRGQGLVARTLRQRLLEGEGTRGGQISVRRSATSSAGR